MKYSTLHGGFVVKKQIPTKKQMELNQKYIDWIQECIDYEISEKGPEAEKMSWWKNFAGWLEIPTDCDNDLDWLKCTLNDWQLLYLAGLEDDNNYFGFSE